MNNDKLIRYGILIAAKEMNVEPIDFAIDQSGILKEKDLTSLYDPVNEFIILSEEWIYNAADAEILLLLFREMRHHYQKLQIKLLEKNSSLALDETVVNVWKKEFEAYKRPYEANQEDYINQEIEIDAVEFSNRLLNDISCMI